VGVAGDDRGMTGRQAVPATHSKPHHPANNTDLIQVVVFQSYKGCCNEIDTGIGVTTSKILVLRNKFTQIRTFYLYNIIITSHGLHATYISLASL